MALSNVRGTFSILFILSPPVPGIGAYFGRDIPSSPIFFPIFANGSIAFPAALLIHVPAMKAIHMKTRAMMSIMIVPKRFPVAESAELIHGITFSHHCTDPSNVYPTHQKVIVVSVHFPSAVFLLTIVSLSLTLIVHTSPSHLLFSFTTPFHESGLWRAAMITSQNESASDTTAGTKAKPMNCDMVKLPSLSASPNAFSPRTYLIVKRGENMAYTQSFIARIRSMNIRARTKSPYMINMSAPMIH